MSYEVPKLLLFKQKNSDPLRTTRTNKRNAFTACPAAQWINDLDRHPTFHIPLMTIIPDITLHGLTANSWSDIMGNFVQRRNTAAEAFPVPRLL